MSESQPQRRWFYPTPAWLVLGSLAVTGLLFLSERWRWFPFNEYKGWTVLLAVAGVGVVMLAMLLWWLVALVFRCRFQFGIRTLLVLTVAVALPCSWLAVEMNNAKRQREALEGIGKLDCSVAYDWQVVTFDLNNLIPTLPDPPGPEWLRNLLGLDFFSDADVVNDWKGTPVTNAKLEYLRGFPKLRQLCLYGTNVTDADVKKLKEALPKCQIDRIESPPSTPAGNTEQPSNLPAIGPASSPLATPSSPN